MIDRRVDYLLEKDRPMCFPNGYEIGVRRLASLLSITNKY